MHSLKPIINITTIAIIPNATKGTAYIVHYVVASSKRHSLSHSRINI